MGVLSPANQALHERIWKEAIATNDRRYWPALDRLLDAAREDGRQAALAEADWQPADTAPKSGEPFQVRVVQTFKWSPYKPDGQRQMGVKGRWQQSGEYGGWTNAPLHPTYEWAPLS